MVALAVSNFGGIAPRISDRLLPDNLATVANNVKLYSGEIRGWRLPDEMHTFNESYTPQTAYRLLYNGQNVWINFDVPVDVVRAPLTNDAFDRYYWSGDGLPKVNSAARIATAQAEYNLGIIQPPDDCTVTPDASGTGTEQTRAYFYTFVSTFGEEGPPSNPVIATGLDDDTWVIAGFTTSLTGDDANRNIDEVRIYRTVAGYGSSTFFKVADIPFGTASYNDTDPDATVVLNPICQSYEWFPPPTDLEGLIVHPNGFLVGFTGRDIYMSEPYRPHAWPPSYVLSTDYDVVGLGQIRNTIIAPTVSQPYALSGISPASLSLSKSNVAYPCLSKRAVVSFSDFVLYPSNVGMVLYDGLRVTEVTKPIMEASDWSTDFLSKVTDYDEFVAAPFGNRYMALLNGSDGFIFEPQNAKDTLTTLKIESAQDVYLDHLSGDTYVLQDQVVRKWDAIGTFPLGWSWKSKEFMAPDPTNFGVAQVKHTHPAEFAEQDPELYARLEAENAALFASGKLNPMGTFVLGGKGPTITIPQFKKSPLGGSGLVKLSGFTLVEPFLVFTAYADGRQVYQNTVDSERPFRLPSGFKSARWQFAVSGNVIVHSFSVGVRGKDLERVI